MRLAWRGEPRSRIMRNDFSARVIRGYYPCDGAGVRLGSFDKASLQSELSLSG